MVIDSGGGFDRDKTGGGADVNTQICRRRSIIFLINETITSFWVSFMKAAAMIRSSQL